MKVRTTGDQFLRAGDLELRLAGSDVRSVCWKGTEVLQRAYYAVRDAPWNTVPGVVRAMTVDHQRSGFSVNIHQLHQFHDIDLACELTFAGRADGELVIRATTVARSAFRYSKVGLNLHHGLRTYRGAPYRARTSEGWVSGCLGEEIQPQLIRGDTLTAMFAHFDALEVDLPGVLVSLRFEGDRFEMQDHRNWCDANWKTYGTPLEYGFPMDCAAGQGFDQTVTLTLSEPAGGPRPAARASGFTTPDVDVELGVADGVLPSVGVDASTSLTSDSLAAVEPAFLRVGFEGPRDERSPAGRWERLSRLGVPVEAVVYVESESVEPARRHVEALAASGLFVTRVVCMAGGGGFSAFRGATPPELVEAWCEALSGSPLADVAVFAGTNQSYNVIARDRPAYPNGVGLVFGGYPQVHASDDESIMQNAYAFADVVRDCRRLYPDRPISMSPVHLISEDGPFPAGPPSSPADRPQDDPRYDSTFAAAWSVAMLAAAAGEHLDAVCLFDAVGPRGVVDAGGRSKPVGSVLFALTGRAGESTRSASTSSPDKIAVLDVGDGPSRLVLVANLRSDRRLARISGWADGRDNISISWIDAVASVGGRSQRIVVRREGERLIVPLEPYAVALLSPDQT